MKIMIIVCNIYIKEECAKVKLLIVFCKHFYNQINEVEESIKKVKEIRNICFITLL